MLIFLVCLVLVLCFVIINSLNSLFKISHSLSVHHKDLIKNLDDRITDLRDHVRRTETALFKAMDSSSIQTHSLQIKQQISALQEEIKHVHNLLDIKSEKAKPKKPRKAKQ